MKDAAPVQDQEPAEEPDQQAGPRRAADVLAHLARRGEDARPDLQADDQRQAVEPRELRAAGHGQRRGRGSLRDGAGRRREKRDRRGDFWWGEAVVNINIIRVRGPESVKCAIWIPHCSAAPNPRWRFRVAGRARRSQVLEAGEMGIQRWSRNENAQTEWLKVQASERRVRGCLNFSNYCQFLGTQ